MSNGIDVCAEIDDFDEKGNPIVCGKQCVAKGLCTKHYQQDRRGNLGNTKKIAAPGEGDEVTVRCPRRLKEAVAKLARADRVDASELWRAAATDYVRRRGGVL